MTVQEGVIPLPEHLLTCGCPKAAQGWHLSTCQPARAHEGDRDKYKDYPDGTRFQGIMWEFPLRLSARISYEVELDPVAFIEKHRDRYDQYEMERGYEPWEKPMLFISSLMEEDIDNIVGGWFGYPRYVSRVDVRCDEISEHPRWTAEMTAQHFPDPEPAPVIDPEPAPVIDPNQGDLFDDV
jgi:hypothetical protein